MARWSSLRRSWEMRWYRQYSRQLFGNEPSDFVALADEEVIDAAHHGDARIRDRGPQLVRGPELVVLRRDDEGPRRDRRKRARREVNIPRAAPHEGDRVGRPAPREICEDHERAEAVAGEAQRKAGRELPGMPDGGREVIGFPSPVGPLAGAQADAAKVEPQRVPTALGARPRDRGDERVAHRAAMRRSRMRDDHDRG